MKNQVKEKSCRSGLLTQVDFRTGLTARPSHGISTVQPIFKTTCLYSLKKIISVKGVVMYSYALGKSQ